MTEQSERIVLLPFSICPGRAVLAEPDGSLYLGRNYEIHRSIDGGATWQFETRMPRTWQRWAIERSRLACRAFRHEVRAMARLSDGSFVAASKKGVYFAAPGQRLMTPARVEVVDFLKPPMMFCVGPGDRVLWGEYNTTNRDRPEVRIYASDDRGRSYHVAFVFPPNEIRHVHNIFHDRAGGHYWVLTGDHQHEPGFGRLSEDLSSFEWLVRGKQDYRAVSVFDMGDHFIYGTDTENEKNYVVRLDKQSGLLERLAPLGGSCIYSCKFGSAFAVSTTVEISKANPSRDATMLLSRDGERWQTVLSARKDALPQKIFQWGSIILPRGESPMERVIYSGQALCGLDGMTTVADIQ